MHYLLRLVCLLFTSSIAEIISGAVNFLNGLNADLKKCRNEVPPCSCELNSYFSSLTLFGVCAEAGNLSFLFETFPQAIRLCKHQSEMINYARQEEIEGGKGQKGTEGGEITTKGRSYR